MIKILTLVLLFVIGERHKRSGQPRPFGSCHHLKASPGDLAPRKAASPSMVGRARACGLRISALHFHDSHRMSESAFRAYTTGHRITQASQQLGPFQSDLSGPRNLHFLVLPGMQAACWVYLWETQEHTIVDSSYPSWEDRAPCPPLHTVMSSWVPRGMSQK